VSQPFAERHFSVWARRGLSAGMPLIDAGFGVKSAFRPRASGCGRQGSGEAWVGENR